MSENKRLCTVMDLPTEILKSLFAPLGLPAFITILLY